jgi:hypothetical protein
VDRVVDERTSRRLFLRFLATSPLFAGGALAAAIGPTRERQTEGPEDRPRERRTTDPDDPPREEPREDEDGPHLIARPAEAINVFDFEPVARKKLTPAHYGYLATGVDDDSTVRANRQGYSKIRLRVRRLVDVSRIHRCGERGWKALLPWSYNLVVVRGAGVEEGP